MHFFVNILTIDDHRKTKNVFEINISRIGAWKLIGHITAAPFHAEKKMNVSVFSLPLLVNLFSERFAITNSLLHIIVIKDS